jgi:cytochrome c-type biogenesis protein CcmH/NrfF
MESNMKFTPEVLWGPAILLLLAALIWGMVQYRRRNRGNDAVTEQAAKTLYDDPAHYDEKREDLVKDVNPS